MNISFNWLKDYIDIDLTPEELAKELTARGIAIDKVQNLNKGITSVVVAKVVNASKHPDADKLKVCEVTTDGTNSFQVVCGAPNVDAGQKIPFAMVGAKLPGDFKIKKAKLRGVESLGMICSAKELGLNEDFLTPEQKEGILVLDENAPLGKSIVEVLNIEDSILELDLTPNRSDCLSVINVAREISVIVGKEINFPNCNLNEIDKQIEEFIDIEIQDADLCPRYSARVIENVQIKPSPLWLQHKLNCAGIRAINNVVDITNFVMLEMGQPLHAFDYDLLKQKKIVVRKASDKENMTTLDELERQLDESMLVITDSLKPIALAGVMGGASTEVSSNTKTILLESAYFNPQSVRKTSTKLGLRSESSMRFEKGINIETVIMALDRAASLIESLAEGKVLKGHVDKYVQPKNRTNVNLKLRKVNDCLGTDLSNDTIKEILQSLQFTILNEDESSINIEVPPYRPDVTIEEDLIEEIARIYGYDNIPVTLPYGNTNLGCKTKDQKFRDSIIENLESIGLNEIINFSFINKNNLDKILLQENDVRREVVTVMNPLSEEQGVMRTTLLPSLLETMRKNVNRRNESLGLFELGKVYLPKGFPENNQLPDEEWVLGIALRGKQTSYWQEKGSEVDFYYLKGIVEYLLKKLNIESAIFKAVKDNESYHPGKTANIYVQDQLIGVLGEIHPKVSENFDLPARNYIAEINVEKLMQIDSNVIKYESLPKYPGTTRDLAIVLSEEIEAYEVMENIKVMGGELLRDVKLFDLYQGNQIADKYKSLAFSLIFQAHDRTLVDEEINSIYEKIQKSLEQKFNASLRA
ncbi:phenylalanyl-tRNA synthetase beta subunit [Desulfonispora thiosulfatigenes DSM 11270]|uniref:Phenylalanine--tRNA ligase beta subunit n=1 Tax=Desulfonispora thiosulfatigenes DSM 11270 TaxID=656914 RepID=A0A1W1VRH2_DESTI|nr:phenylalanine--tRNA ligase subunit beta [Desulfonispora thiosulfatigenes]SMB95975.1 phenylalanyl-tRNA synthetase beta subunit [Desulfonispora thiosulfatigenes DSM 11270]